MGVHPGILEEGEETDVLATNFPFGFTGYPESVSGGEEGDSLTAKEAVSVGERPMFQDWGTNAP